MEIDRILIKKMLELYGEAPQLAMIAEEATELSLAVQKYLRKVGNAVPGKAISEEELIEDMIEEAADMYIVLENIRELYGDESIQKQIDRKIRRQWKRVSERT